MKNVGLMISTLHRGGAERVVSHLSFMLSQKYNIHIILFETSDVAYEFKGKLHDLNVQANSGNVFSKISLFVKRVKKVNAIIEKEKLDCIISFLDSPNFVNLFTSKKKCKKIISIRNFSSLENKQNILGMFVDIMMKLVYRRAHRVITVSKLMEREFINNYSVPQHRICTIYNPYNFAEINRKSLENLNEEENAFFEKHFVYINVGRIMYQKGIWHLIKSFSEVVKKNPDARLVLVGDDHTGGKLKELIKSLRLEKNILLTGATANPYKYLYRAHSYVLTSLFEGFPNAMVEAMVCGCAIVAADCKSGPREILCENVNLDRVCEGVELMDYGILLSELEKDEDWTEKMTSGEKLLEQAMNILIDDRKLCEQLAKKSIIRSRTFDYETCCQAFSDIIEN